MKKLRIDVDQLQVESFEVEAPRTERGTVHGHVPYTHPGWCAPSADVYCTYGDCTRMQEFTCGGTGCQTYEVDGCYRQSFDPTYRCCVE